MLLTSFLYCSLINSLQKGVAENVSTISKKQKIHVSVDSSINNRVFALSQKINHLAFSHPCDGNRKIQNLQNQCDELENIFENFKNSFKEKMFDLNHYFTKIDKELSHDYGAIDKICKDKIASTDANIKQLITSQSDQRRATNSKIIKFIDEHCTHIRNLLELEQKAREQEGNTLEESLASDLRQINEKLQESKFIWDEQFQTLQKQFASKTQNLHRQLQQNCQEYVASEGQFYTMLRDLVKKTKDELSMQRSRRQETEEQILGLIERMCERLLEGMKSS